MLPDPFAGDPTTPVRQRNVGIHATRVDSRRFGALSVGVNRLERLFAINELLRREAPRRVSAQRLADEFSVSRRTIERDIASLHAAGVPLYAERGRRGGHVRLEELGSVVVTFTPTEVTALLVALAAASPSMPFADAGRTAMNRLLDALPATSRLAVEELRGRIRSSTAEAPGEPAGRSAAKRESRLSAQPPGSTRRVRRTVEAAVREAVVVNIEYVDGDGRTSERGVEAHGFYRSGDHWYLIGWCHLRQDGRIFRLDRIRRAHRTKRANEQRDLDDTLGWVPEAVSAP